MAANITVVVMANFTGILVLLYFIARIYDNNMSICDDPQLEPNFDVNKYMGRWYEMMREDVWFQSGECGHVFYTLNPDNS